MLRLVPLLLAATAICGQPTEPSRASLYRSLRAGHVLDPDRMLVHLSHTCTLRIDGRSYPVVEVRELVKGASTPRGVNRILVLSPAMKLVQTIDYTNERPLLCQANRLYLWADIHTDSVEGNVLEFGPGAREMKASHVEPNDLPVTPTAKRTGVPQ